MKSQNNPRRRKDEIIVQELNGEVLIYDLKSNKAICLNEVSSLVWDACDGNQSVSEISQAIGKKLNSPANEDIVWLALDQLKKERLIANDTEIVSKFDGISRREVIRKVGLGTMIALPLITSLVAPTAANAQSICAGACTCTSTGMTVGAGNPCAPPNMGGCSTSLSGCTCRANDNGNNFSGTCS